MRHSTLGLAESKADLARLDEMIATLKDGDADLLKEHLQSARQYLSGAMQEQYLVSLEGARTALDIVLEGNIRNRLEKTIAGLTDDISRASRRPTKQSKQKP